MDDVLFRLIESNSRLETLLNDVVIPNQEKHTTQVSEMDSRVKGVEATLAKYEPTWKTLFAIHSTSRATKIVIVGLIGLLAAIAGLLRNAGTIAHLVAPR
jgi:hypothetical protein